MQSRKIKVLRKSFLENIDVLIALMVIVLVAFLLAGRFLSAEGTVLFGDFVPTLKTRQFLDTNYLLWSNRNTFNYVGSMRLPYLLVFYLPFYVVDAPAEAFFKFMILSTLVVAGVSSYVATRHFLRKYDADVKVVFACCLFSSIFYAFNPWVMDRIYHIFLLVTYSFAPLILLFSYKAFTEDVFDFKRLLVLVLVCSLALTSPHSVFFILLLILSLYVFLMLVDHRRLVSSTKRLALFGVLYMLVNAFWILPLANYMFSAGSLHPDYVVHLDDISVFSRNSSLPNVLSLVAYWWPKVSYSFGFFPLNSLWVFASLMIPAFCFLALVFCRRSKVAVYLSLLGVVTVFLAEGTKSIPGVYEWLCFDAPILGSFGWLFRDPNKWTLLLPLAYSVLLALACLGSIRLFRRFRAGVLRKAASLVLFFLLFSLLFIYITPSAVNYFGGPFKPVSVPPEIYAVNDWLGKDSASYNVLWVPSYAQYGASWVYGGLSGAFELDSSAKPTFDSSTEYSKGYLDYFGEVLWENRSSRTADYLNPLNVRYVIFHNDSASPEYAGHLFESLQNNGDFELVKHDGTVYVFENRGWSQGAFRPFGNVTVVVGGFDKLVSLNVLDLNSSVIFADQGVLKDNVSFDKLVLSGDLVNDAVPFFLEESLVVTPFDFVRRHSPAEDWSRASLSDLSGGAFHPYLEERGIKCWDFDYDQGVAFTWAPNATLGMSCSLASSGNYTVFVRVLESTAGGRVAVYLDDLPVGAVDTRSQINRFEWKAVGSLSMESGKHTLTLENVDGLNAANLLAIMPNSVASTMNGRFEHFLQDKDLLYAFEAESDMVSENASVYGGYGGEASNGQVVFLNSSSRVLREIELACTGNYSLAVRGKGDMVLRIDGNTYEISLKQFGWITLGPVALNSGKHEMEVTGSSDYAAELDVTWLLKNGLGHDLSGVLDAGYAPAKILNVTEIDPTRFVVELDADSPFMLQFSDAYDPAWTASFNGQTVKPVRLFGVANGFWINTAGKVSVTVVFEPQSWFYDGVAISSASLLSCVAVTFYSWWRKKGRLRPVAA